MNHRPERPKYEVAQVIPKFGPPFKSHRKIPTQHLRTLKTLQLCRTAHLGGHVDFCSDCHKVIRLSYNSCRNRHCPKCGGLERQLWIQDRLNELLPLTYYHVVFTIPQQLNIWCLYNPKFCYDLIFKAAWKTIQTFAKDQKFLGAQTAATMILHTWGQNLSLHPHVHAIVPGGGIDQRKQWRKPKRKNGQLSTPPDAPKTACQRRQWREKRYQQAWVVYAKAPFCGPKSVVEYWGRYTHKVAISNHRICNIGSQKVHFRYKDYRQKGQTKTMALDGVEFLRRFCLHILPPGFRRMRHYGFLANRSKKRALDIARKALQQPIPNTVVLTKKNGKFS